MQPVKRIVQDTYHWSMRRASLSNDIQRRWLPSQSSSDAMHWSALPIVHASFAPHTLISRSMDRKPSIASAEEISTQPLRTVHIDRKMTIPSTGPAPQSPVQISRATFLSSSRDVPTSNADASDAGSHPSPGSSEAFGTQAQASLPEAAESGQPSSEEMISRAIGPEILPVVSPSRVMANPVPRGAHVLQRQISVARAPAIRPDSTPPSTLAARYEPIARQVDDPGPVSSVDFSSALQHINSEVVVTLPIRSSDPAIQRTSAIVLESRAERIHSPLPLVRPLPVHAETSSGSSLLQMAPSVDHQQHRQPLVNLIQRQPQTTEVPASSSSTNSTTSSSTPSQVVESGSKGGVDLDKISEEVLRIILNRMAVERERRGIGPWH